MLLIVASSDREAQKKIQRTLDLNEISHVVCHPMGQTIIVLETKAPDSLLKQLREDQLIEKWIAVNTPYKLVSRAFKKEDTIVRVGDTSIGDKKIILMAGPCAIESKEQIEIISDEMKDCKVSVLRGSAYKPRSSPYSFQGLGKEGLEIHKKAQEKHGMLIETEVMDIRDIEDVVEHVDLIRIGARNMQNFDLLKEVAKKGKPVILKRGISATIEEWLLSAEYLMTHGCSDVILCERGIRTFEKSTRSSLDLSSIPILKQLTHLPVIVDPSHAAGRKDIIPALAKAAVAVGADGLLIEVHHAPEEAKCDGPQALLPSEFSHLVDDLEKLAESIGRAI